MYNKKWKKEICTIPNLLSLLRLLLIPVYMKVYLQADQDTDYLLAGSILALSCITDLADGKIAREFHMISQVGKILDPLADKLTQLVLLISLSEKYPIIYPMTALFVLKEIFQLGAMLFFAQKGKALPGALVAGKICTAVLFVTLTVLVLFPHLEQRIIRMLITVDTILIVVSFYSYFLAYLGRNTKLTDLKTE